MSDDKSKWVCGIDPMTEGAIAYLDTSSERRPPRVVDMPVVKISKTRRELDIPSLWKELLINEPMIAYVERMQPMGLGGNASFKAGAYREAFRMAFQALGVPLVEIQPKEWQKAYGITSKAGIASTKGQSYMIASKLFPEVDLITPKGRIIDGRADALLIAHYGLRVMGYNAIYHQNEILLPEKGGRLYEV
jgi:hypothetical protein